MARRRQTAAAEPSPPARTTIIGSESERSCHGTAAWTDGRHLELKLHEDPTIDEGCRPGTPGASGRPLWDGTRLPAARLLVVAGEGDCDTLALGRLLPALAARVLSLTLAAPAEQLSRLLAFAATFGNLPLADLAAPPPHDLVLPLASVPAVLGLKPGDVPPPLPRPVARAPGGAIGLALAPDAPAAIVATLRAAFPGVRLLALDDAAARQLGGEPIDADPPTLTGLDLVVATDGAVAHAAGSLGVPLWLLVDAAPHWIWGPEGRLSRWYPAARLFRAAGPTWQGVAEALAAEAAALAVPGLSDVAALRRLAGVAEEVDGAAAALSALPFALRLAALRPADPDAWARLVGLLLRLDDATDADHALAAGLAAGPRHGPLLRLAARRDLERGNPAAALRHAEQALGADPASVAALATRAAALAALGEPAKAEFALRQAVQAAPRRADLLVAWGEALRRLGDDRAAGRAFERAAVVEDSADARLGLGRIALAAGDSDVALHFLNSAVARDDGHAEAAIDCARALHDAGRVAEAIGVLRRLVARRPSPSARALLGELLLASGDFTAGLVEFEGRHAAALPDLADIAGRPVMLTAEGDAGVLLRFLRFVPRLKAAGATHVGVAGADELAPLLADVAGLDGMDGPSGALHLPIMSLPALFGLGAGDLASGSRCLTPDPAAVTDAALSLAGVDGFRVGVAPGGPDLPPLSGIVLVDLDADLAAVAAALPNLDAVVAPATSPVAALAGAVGRPAFVLAPDRDDWLWLERDGRTPWFPSTRLFRRRPGETDMAAPSQRLAAALAAFAAGDRAVPYRPDPPPPVALADQPDAAATLARAGLEALARRDDHRAVLLIGDAVAAGATDPELRQRLAVALLGIGERDRAGQLLAALIAEAPTAERLAELSEVERTAGRPDEALAHAERAAELRPDLPRAHRAAGRALIALGRPQEALAAYGRAVALAPADPELALDEAEALLIAGDYRRGFARREIRWRAAQFLPRRFEVPRWTGEDIAGRTLLVHGEPALGADIAFARFLPQVAARGARLVVEVRPALIDLYRRLDLAGDVTIVEQGRRLPPHDLEVPLLSLPHVLGIDRAGLPPPAAFRPDPLRVDAWRRTFGDRFTVGLYWRSAEDAALYAPLADLDGVSLVALDRRAGRAMLAALPPGLAVESLGARLGGLVETAAAIAALDAVVAPASATAHLAATLLRPTVVVDPPADDWLLGGEGGSPWYPAVRRLRRGGDLAGLLGALVRERSAP
ncbi:tetratricopeptide repeat protein [Pleomorphomonas koreensis]|uniref:tetratricopeptide repeat protein n=1 Tax=Pleomorphomonas koreensis TaxID=257440 RepID=UPI000424C98B|nr:tetratricopeptide repeat protein [Pleomorphomonas koreensis]